MNTVFATILAGVTVFVLGQIFLKWFIEPIQELRRVIAEVVFHLANEHATIHNADMIDKDKALSAGRTLEELGARLMAAQHLIPFYDKTSKTLSLPSRDDIVFAAKRLSLISKSMFARSDERYERLDVYRKDICNKLRIEDPIKGGATREELVETIKTSRGNRGT
jgi:hypothetical protein